MLKSLVSNSEKMIQSTRNKLFQNLLFTKSVALRKKILNEECSVFQTITIATVTRYPEAMVKVRNGRKQKHVSQRLPPNTMDGRCSGNFKINLLHLLDSDVSGTTEWKQERQTDSSRVYRASCWLLF